MSARLVAPVVALIAALLPSPASATEFRDAQTGFRVALDFPDARLCILKPAELTDAAACEGVDLAKARTGAQNAPTRLVGLVIRPEGRWFLGVLVVDRPAKLVTTRDARQYAVGVSDGFKRRFSDVQIAKLADVDAHGAPAFRFENSWTAGAFPYDAAWTGVILGEKHLFQIQLMGTSAELTAMEQAGDAMLRSAYEPHAGPAARSTRIGRLIRVLLNHVMLSGLILLLLVAVAVAIRLARRRS